MHEFDIETSSIGVFLNELTDDDDDNNNSINNI